MAGGQDGKMRMDGSLYSLLLALRGRKVSSLQLACLIFRICASLQFSLTTPFIFARN